MEYMYVWTESTELHYMNGLNTIACCFLFEEYESKYASDDSHCDATSEQWPNESDSKHVIYDDYSVSGSHRTPAGANSRKQNVSTVGDNGDNPNCDIGDGQRQVYSYNTKL